MSVREQQIPTALGHVHVEVSGEGPAMFMWPSLVLTGEMWRGQAAHFAATHTVIAVDPPGQGRSDRHTRTSFSYEQCVQTIIDLLDGLDVAQADYLGNSWGGMIGATVAARHPERIRSAVLMNCTASPPGLKQRVWFEAMVRGGRLFGGLRGPLAPQALAAFLGPTSRRSRPDAVEYAKRTIAAAEVGSVACNVRSVVLNRPDQRPLLGTIGVPVTVVAGSEDDVFTNAETREMADRIPGARFVLIDGAAHLVALEVPDRVNAVIEEHLALVDARVAA